MPTSQLWDEMNKQQIPDEDVREGSVEPDDYTPEWNPHVTDDVDEILVGQCVNFFLSTGLDILAQGAQMIILDDHAHNRAAVGVCHGPDRLNLTGNGSMNRNTQTLIITDLLTDSNQIALLDEGLAGGADMLGHGNYQDIRFGEYLSLLVTSVPLIFFGMDPSEKRKRHITSPLSIFAEITALFHYI